VAQHPDAAAFDHNAHLAHTLATSPKQQQEILDSIQQANLRAAEEGSTVIINHGADDSDMKHYEVQLGNEESKFEVYSNADRQTRAQTASHASHANTTSKKRSREEMSDNLSLYEQVQIAQREQLGMRVHENRQ
jgi:hypothetical protein